MRAFGKLGNYIVRLLLRSPLHWLLSPTLLLLCYRGRRTGALHTLPVMYARDNGMMIVLAARPREKSWWRNLQGGVHVAVWLEGRRYEAVAEVLGDDPDTLERALKAYVRRFPRTAKRLGIDRDEIGTPTPDGLVVAGKENVLVRIRITAPARDSIAVVPRAAPW